jgi:hypothetical protein
VEWQKALMVLIARLGSSLCAGLFLRVGPCHFDFEEDRAGAEGSPRE